ncbi:MAG: tRNA pseudouridine(38-40) synthase TruA [Treponema sp.]|jgi:tRNA pseudouridine38-40 synthase|nr:tRNA pseudouridine(38-40) synthase TruA [Treponema sp.]
MYEARQNAGPPAGGTAETGPLPQGRNIRLLIAYDGTDFCGWQRQHSEAARPSVQGTLEAALEKIHRHQVPLTGAGRTDAGVHAVGQTANFYTSIGSIPPERFVPALNKFLPGGVRILEARETRKDFHSRFDAKSRTYRYQLICGRPALPHELRYSLSLRRRPRIGLLNDYGRLLLGERDCSLFASPGDSSVSRFRYISRCGFFVQGDTLVFEISANAFLWKMVRSVLGTLLFFEERNMAPEALAAALEQADHRLSGPTLPGQGLFLWKIDYYRD